jgi:hypothetical protein
MVTGAFGSPIPMVHGTKPQPRTQGTIGTHIVKAATQVRLFARDSNSQSNNRTNNKRNRISLCLKDGTLIGEEVLDVNFTTGMVLDGVKIFPNEVDVQVMQVWKPGY